MAAAHLHPFWTPSNVPISARRLAMAVPKLSCSSSSPSTSPSSSPPPSLPSKPKPWLLVGLGNPGKAYHRTRHNVGFEMLDAIAEAEGISMNTVQFKALFGKDMMQLRNLVGRGSLGTIMNTTL